MENPNSQWVHQLFLWPCSIAKGYVSSRWVIGIVADFTPDFRSHQYRKGSIIHQTNHQPTGVDRMRHLELGAYGLHALRPLLALRLVCGFQTQGQPGSFEVFTSHGERNFHGCRERYIWGFPARHGGTPLSLDGFFVGKSHRQMNDVKGYPCFQETTILMIMGTSQSKMDDT